MVETAIQTRVPGAEEEPTLTPEPIPNLAALSPDELMALGGMRQLEHLVAVLPTIISKMRAAGAAPTGRKKQRLFRPSEAAELMGRSESSLRRDAEELGIDLLKNPKQPTWRLFSPEDLLAIRRAKQVEPYRRPGKPPIVLAFSNQKGGASKTTTALNFAHDMANRGYRILMIDLDPQQSLTSSFEACVGGELQPCTTFEPEFEATIGPIIQGDHPLIQDLICHTHWPSIDLIPAGAELVEAEMTLTGRMSTGTTRMRFYRYLRNALRELPPDHYDIVVLDTPPSMNLTTVEAGAAADGMVIPCPPRAYDVSSLFCFTRILHGWLGALAPDEIPLKWVRVLPTMVHRQSKAERLAMALLNMVNSQLMLAANGVPFLEAVKRGTGATPTAYETVAGAPKSSASTSAQARREFREAHDAILNLIAHTWVSESA